MAAYAQFGYTYPPASQVSLFFFFFTFLCVYFFEYRRSICVRQVLRLSESTFRVANKLNRSDDTPAVARRYRRVRERNPSSINKTTIDGENRP